jgi:hypothetical protein
MLEADCTGRFSFMRVSYQMTVGEYVAAQLLNYRTSTHGVFILIFYLIAAPILGFIMLIGAGSVAWRSGHTPSSLSGLVVPGLILFMPLWLQLFLRSRFRATRISDSVCRLNFEEDNINTELPGFSKSTIEWAAVKKYRASKRVLLIYVSRASFLVVPLRAFASGEYEGLVAILRRKMSHVQL